MNIKNYMILTYKMIRGHKVKAMISDFRDTVEEANAMAEMLRNKQHRYLEVNVVKIWG